jgi:predicted alpha/beta-fold hydrolase
MSNIDQNIFPKMFGFKNDKDYYQKISATGRLKKIKIPTFLLKSKDDFTFNVNEIPIDEIK